MKSLLKSNSYAASAGRPKCLILKGFLVNPGSWDNLCKCLIYISFLGAQLSKSDRTRENKT